MSATSVDVAVVGGGLAGALIAWRLAQARPELRLALIEREATLGGNHTWCFHAGDVSAAQLEWLRPCVAHTWAGYEVRFPRLTRRLPGGYHSVSSARLHTAIAPVLARHALRLHCGAREVAAGHVVLADGTRVDAACVIDARGDVAGVTLPLGYQKFLGLELDFEYPHGLGEPLLMDATVAQRGGFRFVYVLPLDARRALVEDTLYADTSDVDADDLRDGVRAYAASRGWRVVAEGREERGVLPIPLGGDVEALLLAPPADVPKAGLRAGLFHPTTGYSLPEAVRLAEALGELPRETLRSAPLLGWQREISRRHWKHTRFERFLNRMLLRAARPERRFRVLQRFYALPAGLIARFYAGRSTWADRARLLTGRPPVPVWRALACLREPGAVTA